MYLRRATAAIVIFISLAWVPLLFIGPALNYNKGTAENVSFELVSSPYIDSDVLKTFWSGDVVRSCPITLRREIIDSRGYVKTLQPTSYSALPRHMLGQKSFPIDVQTPKDLPEGDTIYSVTEYPTCSVLQWMFPVGIAYPEVKFTVEYETDPIK